MSNSSRSVAALDDLAVISIQGAEAAIFLNSQLTHDVAALKPGQAQLAGYCTAKGRLLATFVVWSDPGQAEQLYALVKADIAPATLKKLSMFVLRAKAKLSLADLKVYGVTGPLADPAATDPAYTVKSDAIGTWIAAPSASPGLERHWVIMPSAGTFPAQADAAAEADGKIAADTWRAQDIAAGLPWIQGGTQDVFIPQTLNMDLIDGVSFTKGCYPGQEVVARSHYRGTVKRRMAYGTAQLSTDLAHSQYAQTLVGTDIYDARKPNSPCGRVINAAFDSQRWHFLLEVQLADLADADYRQGSAQGMAIDLHALPYKIS